MSIYLYAKYRIYWDSQNQTFSPLPAPLIPTQKTDDKYTGWTQRGKKKIFRVGIKPKNLIFIAENRVFKVGGEGLEPPTSCL